MKHLKKQINMQKMKTIAFDIKHIVEEKKETSLESQISSAIKSGLILGVVGLIVTSLFGIGRRD